MNNESSAHPKRDKSPAPASGPTGSRPVLPPPPVFKPDPRISAQVARARHTMLVLTAVLVLVALVVLVAYRPRFAPQKQALATDTLPVPAGVSSPVQDRSHAAPVTAPVPADPISKTRAARAAIDRLVQVSNDRWLRAQELLPSDVVDTAGARAAMSSLRRAAVIEDSAAADVVDAGLEAVAIRDIARAPDAAQSAYGISLVYTSADQYLKVVTADVRDRQSYLAVTGEALAALVAGDIDEHDVKTNVANSYRYRSDDRQRTIKRLSGQLAQAERELH